MTSKENQASTDFSALALSPATLANLQQLGYTQMTPIQAASLPPALLGKDLIAQASTGSGKTAAFALALLANLNPRRSPRPPRFCSRHAPAARPSGRAPRP